MGLTKWHKICRLQPVQYSIHSSILFLSHISLPYSVAMQIVSGVFFCRCFDISTVENTMQGNETKSVVLKIFKKEIWKTQQQKSLTDMKRHSKLTQCCFFCPWSLCSFFYMFCLLWTRFLFRCTQALNVTRILLLSDPLFANCQE